MVSAIIATIAKDPADNFEFPIFVSCRCARDRTPEKVMIIVALPVPDPLPICNCFVQTRAEVSEPQLHGVHIRLGFKDQTNHFLQLGV